MAIFTHKEHIRKVEGASSSSHSRMPVKIDERGASSSSGSDKFKKNSSLVVGRQELKDKELEIQGDKLLKRKKRLDAHSYITSLIPVANKAKNSDAVGICRKVSDDEGERTGACPSSRINLEAPEVVESSSGGQLLADVDTRSFSETTSCKRAKITAELSRNTQVTEKASMTDVTSSPYESVNGCFEECTACSEPRSMLKDSEDQALCLCNARTRHNLCKSLSKTGGQCEEMGNTGIAEGHLSTSHATEPLVAFPIDSGHQTCTICQRPGLLLLCNGKGCKRSYHLSCLEPPMKDIPPGIWHCINCTKKKIELGVYSVSEGIESIWDSKEEMQNDKHYFVKYKGLAHVHDRWIPERLVFDEAPMLLAKFRKHRKEKVRRWKKEWTEPHRLLLKRFLIPSDLTEHGKNFPYCRHEWLVKWKGLHYEHCTFELENSSFLRSSKGLSLIKDYERWREESRNAYDPARAEKALSVKNTPLDKISRLPDQCTVGLDSDYLNSTNKLREFWHRSQNAVFVDDQDRIVKSILFILSLMSNTYRPFLIITTINCLSSWEAEFIRLASSINLVVYSGNQDTRKIIQTLEFYEEGGRIMFQVLLSHPKAIVEDLESFNWIAWEAIIIDECQNSRVSTHFEQLRILSSDFKLLLLNGSLKDDFVEYLSLLSFLDPNFKIDSNDGMDILAILKERLSCYVAYECKTTSSKFLEYWVPVHLSTMQLKQYCGILVSNSLPLCSQLKRDNVGTIRDVLISTRKCCDHPYLVDETLRSSLVKGHMESKHLDYEVNASGKLHLLDLILQEIKTRGLRVLILFQSADVARRVSIGDILDDFVRERFGTNSYERVEKGMNTSAKQAAFDMFNDKASGRFVFLIETRACVPSVKLSSIDAVIIFNSDWSPVNDSKALQKMNINSTNENVLVFRLYSSCTVEEKVLLLSKQQMSIESNIQKLNSSICHSLLSWGASKLFSKLHEFEQHDMPSHFETSSDRLLVNELVELLIQLPKVDATDLSNQSTVAKAPQSGAFYSSNIILDNEKESSPSMDEDGPYKFWQSLLGRNSHQISGSCQLNRRKLESSDEFAKGPCEESDGSREKCTRFPHHGGACVNPTELNSIINKSSVRRIDVAEGHIHEGSSNITPSDQKVLEDSESIAVQSSMFVADETKNLMKGRRSEISSSDYQEIEEGEIPNTNDHSVHPVFVDQEVAPVLKTPDTKVEYCIGPLGDGESIAVQSSVFVADETKNLMKERRSKISPDYQEIEEGEIPNTNDHSVHPLSVNLEVAPVLKTPDTKNEYCIGPLRDEPSNKQIDLIDDICSRRLNKLLLRQNHDVDEFKVFEDQERLRLMKNHDLDLDIIRSRYVDAEKRNNEIKFLREGFAKKMSEFDQHVKSQRRKLAVMHVDARNKEKQIKNIWIEEANAGKLAESFHKLPMSDSGFSVDTFFFKGQSKDFTDPEKSSISRPSYGQHCSTPKPGSSTKTTKVCTGSSIVPSIEMEDMQRKAETPASDSSIMSVTRSVIPHLPSVENCKVLSPGCEGNMPPTEIPDHSNSTKEVCNLTNGMNKSSTSQVIADNTQHGRADSDGARMPSLLLSQPKFISSPHSSGSFGFEKSASCDQVLPVIEQERPSISGGLGKDHSFSTSTIPLINGSSQVGPTNVDLAVSNVILLQPPQSFGLGSVGNGDLSTSEPVSTEQGCCKQMGDCTHQTDVSMQQPPVAIVVHMEKSLSQSVELGTDQDISSSMVPSPDGASSQVGRINDDATVLKSSFLQPSTSVGLTSVVNGHACTSEPVRTEPDPNNQMRYSADQTSALTQQPAMTTSVHKEQPLSQSDPMPRAVDVPSQYLRTTDAISDVGCHLPQIFPLWETMPRQGLHTDPLQNELMMLQKKKNLYIKMNADKKLQLKLECQRELDKVRKKYDTLIQDADTEFLKKNMTLDAIFKKVLMNQSLAEEFRAKFAEVNGGSAVTFHGTSSKSVPHHHQTLLPQLPQSLSSASVPTSHPAASVLPPMQSTPPRPLSRPIPPSMRPVYPEPTSASGAPFVRTAHISDFPSNLVRPHFRPIRPSHTNFDAGNGLQTPPHLRPSRNFASMPAPHLTAQSGLMVSQQQSLGNMSSFSQLVVSDPANDQCYRQF